MVLEVSRIYSTQTCVHQRRIYQGQGKICNPIKAPMKDDAAFQLYLEDSPSIKHAIEAAGSLANAVFSI